MAKKNAPTSPAQSFFRRTPGFNSIVHLSIGLGLGMLLTHTVVDPHPLRWGLGLIFLGVLGYVYPWAAKK